MRFRVGLPRFREIVGLFAAFSSVGTLRAADAAEATASRLVTLPAYVVTDVRDLPPPQKWRYARVADLEVISSAGEGATRHLVRDFQRFRQALELVWPDVQQANARVRTLTVCGRTGEFAAFAPKSDDGSAPSGIALALRDREQGRMVLDFATTVLGSEQTSNELAQMPGTEEARRVGDRHRQLYRAYVRFLLAATQPRSPAWFEEGLAQLLMSIDINDREVTVGRVADPNTILEGDGKLATMQDLDFNAVLLHGRVLPMKEVLEMSPDAPEAQSAQGNVWAKQCYAFVHWGLYGDEGRHQKMFVTFLARLTKQPLSEELFQRTFNQSYAQMTQTLRTYAEMTSFRVAGVKAEKGYTLPLAVPFELREATESEAARIQGETLLAAGKLEPARQTMALPYRRGERDADLLAAIGLLEIQANEIAAATKFLELAASAKTTRSRALIELAKLRLEAVPATARLKPEQLAGVLTPLFSARGQPPAPAELYLTIARAWERSGTEPEAAHLVVLDEGVRLYPWETDLVCRAAALKARIGRAEEASALIALGLRHTTDPEARAKLTALAARTGARK